MQLTCGAGLGLIAGIFPALCGGYPPVPAQNAREGACRINPPLFFSLALRLCVVMLR